MIPHDHHHLYQEYCKNKLLTTTSSETKGEYYVFHPHSKLSSGNHVDEIQLSRDKRAPQIGFIVI
jgi:hypothetical protein